MLDMLRQLSYLRSYTGLSEDDLRAIVLAGRLERHRRGSVLFREGDACAGLVDVAGDEVHGKFLLVRPPAGVALPGRGPGSVVFWISARARLALAFRGG